MSSFRIRPRFKNIVEISPSEVRTILKTELKKPNINCIGTITDSFIVLKVPEEEQHYWSPQLRLSVEEEDEGTVIRGLYGPNPTVWALFFYMYAAIGVFSFFLAIYGFAKMSLGLDASILWWLPIFAVIAFILYLIAQTGQKLGAQQMFTLHQFFETAIDAKIKIQ